MFPPDFGRFNHTKGFLSSPIICSFFSHPHEDCLQPSDPAHIWNLSRNFLLVYCCDLFGWDFDGAWMVHARLVLVLFDVKMIRLKAESASGGDLSGLDHVLAFSLQFSCISTVKSWVQADVWSQRVRVFNTFLHVSVLFLL